MSYGSPSTIFQRFSPLPYLDLNTDHTLGNLDEAHSVAYIGGQYSNTIMPQYKPHEDDQFEFVGQVLDGMLTDEQFQSLLDQTPQHIVTPPAQSSTTIDDAGPSLQPYQLPFAPVSAPHNTPILTSTFEILETEASGRPGPKRKGLKKKATADVVNVEPVGPAKRSRHKALATAPHPLVLTPPSSQSPELTDDFSLALSLAGERTISDVYLSTFQSLAQPNDMYNEPPAPAPAKHAEYKDFQPAPQQSGSLKRKLDLSSAGPVKPSKRTRDSYTNAAPTHIYTPPPSHSPEIAQSYLATSFGCRDYPSGLNFPSAFNPLCSEAMVPFEQSVYGPEDGPEVPNYDQFGRYSDFSKIPHPDLSMYEGSFGNFDDDSSSLQLLLTDRPQTYDGPLSTALDGSTLNLIQPVLNGLEAAGSAAVDASPSSPLPLQSSVNDPSPSWSKDNIADHSSVSTSDSHSHPGPETTRPKRKNTFVHYEYSDPTESRPPCKKRKTEPEDAATNSEVKPEKPGKKAPTAKATGKASTSQAGSDQPRRLRNTSGSRGHYFQAHYRNPVTREEWDRANRRLLAEFMAHPKWTEKALPLNAELPQFNELDWSDLPNLVAINFSFGRPAGLFVLRSSDDQSLSNKREFVHPRIILRSLLEAAPSKRATKDEARDLCMAHWPELRLLQSRRNNGCASEEDNNVWHKLEAVFKVASCDPGFYHTLDDAKPGQSNGLPIAFSQRRWFVNKIQADEKFPPNMQLESQDSAPILSAITSHLSWLHPDPDESSLPLTPPISPEHSRSRSHFS